MSIFDELMEVIINVNCVNILPLKGHMTAQHGQDSDSKMPQTQLVDETSNQSHNEHQRRPHQPVEMFIKYS